MESKFVSRVLRALLVVGSISLAASERAEAQPDGIYAEFTTSMGSFTCRVEYAKAPKASASFIGLATGERPWLDLPSGIVRSEPFYNGQIFHRVIAGFMNQGGSRNGQGTDGPGYSYVDEFDATLRHDGFGVLSCANSGPDSNGSQFFVTVEPTPWLNDVHTVFGKLTGGSNVVYAINHVATDGNDKPLTNVFLQSVIIRRVGAAAQAFDINAQGLPEVSFLDTGIGKTGAAVSITFSNQLNVDNRMYSTTNLINWSATKLGIETALPVTNSVTLPISSDKQFFRMAQVHYQDALHVPRNLLGKTVTLNFSPGGPGTIIIAFGPAGGGTYTWSLGDPGTITSYTWIQDPYRGRLAPIQYSGIVRMTLHLDFDTSNAGTFSGVAYTGGSSPTPVSGTFTSAP